MTVEERLLFIRAGYSAQDIANFENAESSAKPEQEQKPEQAPEQKPEQAPEQKPEQEPENTHVDDSEPAWAKALAESIKTLTAATQAANRRFDDMGEPEQVADKALEALKNIYGGKN